MTNPEAPEREAPWERIWLNDTAGNGFRDKELVEWEDHPLGFQRQEYLRLDIHEREVRERNDAIKGLLDLLDYDHPEYHNDYHEKLDRARALIGGE